MIYLFAEFDRCQLLVSFQFQVKILFENSSTSNKMFQHDVRFSNKGRKHFSRATIEDAAWHNKYKNSIWLVVDERSDTQLKLSYKLFSLMFLGKGALDYFIFSTEVAERKMVHRSTSCVNLRSSDRTSLCKVKFLCSWHQRNIFHSFKCNDKNSFIFVMAMFIRIWQRTSCNVHHSLNLLNSFALPSSHSKGCKKPLLCPQRLRGKSFCWSLSFNYDVKLVLT